MKRKQMSIIFPNCNASCTLCSITYSISIWFHKHVSNVIGLHRPSLFKILIESHCEWHSKYLSAFCLQRNFSLHTTLNFTIARQCVSWLYVGCGDTLPLPIKGGRSQGFFLYKYFLLARTTVQRVIFLSWPRCRRHTLRRNDTPKILFIGSLKHL
jgi:hypothetical protein